MYNEKQKSEYIQYYSEKESVRTLCERIFKSTQKFEEAWGADLCTKSAEELQPLVDEITGIRTRGKDAVIGILRSYVQWCLNNDIPNTCDGMLQIKEAGTEKYKTQMIPDPLHLQKYLNQVFDAESDLTIGNTYRCYYWLVYGGVLYDDIFKIRTKNISLSDMAVNIGDNSYPIYREALPAFKNCLLLNQFIVNKANYTTYIPRGDGDILIRGTRFPCPAPTALAARVSKIQKEAFNAGKTNLKLNYNHVRLSGIFYKAYAAEMMGTPPDFTWYVDENYRVKNNKRIVPGERNRNIREYEKEYKNWKAVFNL